MGRPRKKVAASAEEAGSSGEKASLTIFVTEGPCEGQISTAKTNRVTVGRIKANNFFIKDSEISQKHAAFEWSTDHWNLIDIGSSYGTFVNNKQLLKDEPIRVEDRDVVMFGSDSVVRLEIRLPLHPDTTVQQWLELETEMSIKRLQRTADRVESDMREAHNLVMEPLMHKLALVTATVKDEQEENQL